MPTYEYRCKDCDHQFDIVQAFTDDPLTDCPECGAAQLRKVYGNVGISFKGSGFYKTDTRGSSSSSTTSTGGDKSTSSGDKSTSSGDKSTSSGDKSSNGSSSSTSSDKTSSSSTTSSD